MPRYHSANRPATSLALPRCCRRPANFGVQFAQSIRAIGMRGLPPMMRLFRLLAVAVLIVASDLAAAPGRAAEGDTQYSSNELIDAGHRVFGKVSQGLASIVERAVSSYGLPNGYIVGQEGAGALVGGVRYGEGILYTKNAGQHHVYWQGPTVGLDLGANGDRTMMLVYNLPAIDSLYQRYVGVNGSAYVVA